MVCADGIGRNGPHSVGQHFDFSFRKGCIDGDHQRIEGRIHLGKNPCRLPRVDMGRVEGLIEIPLDLLKKP